MGGNDADGDDYRADLTEMEYALIADKLNKAYGGQKALDNLSMRVPKGAFYGFVGKNGAGKTTLIRIACGLQRPDSGTVTLSGGKIGAIVENPAVYLNMTAEENLKQQYRLLGRPPKREILKLVGLQNAGRKKARDFSLGMRQRLAIAMALAGNPEILILDEPINGLDPQGIIEMRALLSKLNRERNITILISSHILDELSRLATHYGFIDKGGIVKEMSAAELERARGKSMRVEVSDMEAFSRALNKARLEYKIISETTADIFDKINVTKLVLMLLEEGCEVESVTEHEESLEGYYMNLMGGDENA